MKKTFELPDTIEACHEIIISQARLIEQLQRRAFGGSLKDRAVKYEGPSLFDDVDEQAVLAAKKGLEKASRDVDEAADKRRAEAKAQSQGRGKRPEKYNTYGLPVERQRPFIPTASTLTTMMSSGRTRPTFCICSRSACG